MEIDTIPEYISMYHAERSALKAKFLDKDQHIAEMAQLHERQLKQLQHAREALEQLANDNRQLRRQLRALTAAPGVAQAPGVAVPMSTPAPAPATAGPEQAPTEASAGASDGAGQPGLPSQASQEGASAGLSMVRRVASGMVLTSLKCYWA